MAGGRWLEGKRAECWAIGVQLREALLHQYMAANGLRERPFLKDVTDALIEEIQGARLRTGVLPLDRYAQTESVSSRLEVTINSRIAEMADVKDFAGIAYVAMWHEAVHVDRDMHPGASGASDLQPGLPDLEVEAPRLIVCRRRSAAGSSFDDREFVAETAGLAAAIAGADLARCAPFVRFQRLAADGGDLGTRPWPLLYRTAEQIGVNISALVRYFEQRGVCRIDERRHIIAARQLFKEIP